MNPDVIRVLVEKRCEIYTKVAAQLLDLEEALAEDDASRARYTLSDVRRLLRSHLAFLTAGIYHELEQVERLAAALPEAGEGLSAEQAQELEERLQLLHVQVALALREPVLFDLDEIIGLPQRLRQKLAVETRSRDVAARRRELEEQCWKLEAEARDLIGQRQYARAVKSLRKAIKLDGARAVFHNDLGVVLSLLGRNEEAIGCYETAVRLNEEAPDRRTDEWTTSHYNLGIALRKVAQNALDNGQTAQALERLRQARAAFEDYMRLNVSGPKVQDARRVVQGVAEQITGLEAALEA